MYDIEQHLKVRTPQACLWVSQMRVYVCEGVEVTNFVARILGYKISNAKDTYGCMIVHGCGMDMCFHVVNRLASIVNSIYQNLINGDYYNYVEAGKRRR